MKIIKVLFFLQLLLVAGACIDESECTYETLREVKFSFVNADNLLADTLLIDSITIEGSDSAYYLNTSAIKLTLPISPALSETNYFFDLNENDFAIVLGYEILPRVISEECGVEPEIKKLFVVSHDVDSVVIVNDSFKEEIENHVKVYR